MLGILGGMGPLASAEFLRTLYALHISELEQDAPPCVLLSDPSIPDRTRAILEGSTDELLARLSRALEDLSSLGADRIVIACVTVHHVLPRVPEPLRRKVISLIDLVIDEVLAVPEPYLLLATTGTRTARIFEQHERWGEIERWIVLPDGGEQRELHERLYFLKREEPDEALLVWLEELASGHEAGGVIFGCTELHLLQRLLARNPGRFSGKRIVDPLLTVARNFKALLGS
ncbi:MAG TPA: aspartate/glutamate racemase family protein [Thermoanaerobaculia bacterium]